MNEHQISSLPLRMLRKIIKETKTSTPEDIAREAFLLVNSAGPHNQVSTAAFLDKLDFAKLKPGSILRVNFKQQVSGQDQWDWLAFGGMGKKKEIYLYAARSKDNLWLTDCKNLQLPPEWKMNRLHVNKPSVHIEDIWGDIYHQTVIGSRDEVYFPQKIDTITGGKTVVVPKKLLVPNFNPVPLRVMS